MDSHDGRAHLMMNSQTIGCVVTIVVIVVVATVAVVIMLIIRMLERLVPQCLIGAGHGDYHRISSYHLTRVGRLDDSNQIPIFPSFTAAVTPVTILFLAQLCHDHSPFELLVQPVMMMMMNALGFIHLQAQIHPDTHGLHYSHDRSVARTPMTRHDRHVIAHRLPGQVAQQGWVSGVERRVEHDVVQVMMVVVMVTDAGGIQRGATDAERIFRLTVVP